MTTTEKAVAQLRAYARYIEEHAESIIGDVDPPNYVMESGIRISFELTKRESAPIVHVSKEYLATNVVEAMSE